MTDRTIVLTGENQTRAFQMLAQRRALMLEIKTGMSISSHSSMSAHLKRLYGFKGQKKKVLEQFEALLTEKGIPFNP